MMMHTPLMIITFILSIGVSLQKTSPCPSVFVYDERDDSNDTWFGTIRLKSNVPLHGVFVDIVFSSPVSAFGTFLQQHHTDDNVVFHVTDKSYQVRAGEIVTIKFYVRFTVGRSVPLLQQIRFNGQNICNKSATAGVASPDRETFSRSQNVPSLETTRDNDYSHVVQPIVTQPPSQTFGQPKYSSSSSSHGPVATREAIPQPINSSPTFGGDTFSPRFKTEDLAEHTSEPRELGTGDEVNLGRGPTTPTIAEKDDDKFFAGDYAFIQKDGPTNGSPHYINDGVDTCGTVVPKPNPLVTHGWVSENGQFPWHGALYRSRVTQLKYLCGATLISRRASVTAAHCVTLANTNRPVDVDSLLVYFGKIELDKWNGPEQDAKISAIHIPSEYNHERFYQDIALLVLKDDVKYSSVVRPICLWSYDTDYKSLINKVGLIPGWGYNDRGLVSSRLSYAQMPVVSHETCIWSNRNFFSRVTSDTSFCAGFKNGTSVCNGDSGGGMVFKISNRWYLRGIVSVSAALQDLLRCNVEHYVVFTDASKFTTWIKNILEATGYQKEYEGTLELRPNITLRYVQLVIQFDGEVEQLRNYFGRITTTDHHSFHIANMTHALQAGSVVKIPLEVSYTSVSKPSIVRIEVNGVTICPVNVRPLVQQFGDPRIPTTMVTAGQRPSLFVDSSGIPSSKETISRSVATTYPEVNSRNATNGPRQQFNSSCQAIRAGVIVSAGRWDAVLHLVAENTVDRAVIDIVFDQPIYMLGNHFGEVTTEDSVRFRIENRTFILAKDAEIELNFFIRYNQMGHMPDVVEINFNGHNYCTQRRRRVLDESRDIVRRTTGAPSIERTFSIETTERKNGASPFEYNECATVLPPMSTRIRSRIIGGVESSQGEHPWHVAIYLDDQYQCGGSIVGRRWILTAAHCLTRQNTNETLEADLFRVYTGIIDISTIDDHFYRTVDEVIVHRDYSPVMYTTDIGLLRLKRNITYNSFIKPVCLYNRTVDISSFYGRDGKVTGWGFNRDGVISNVLNYLEVPVVSQKVCSQRNVQFNGVLAVGESFCAGHADGNSVCNGDSGGGLVFAEDTRYYLRGIVSISAQRRNLLICDANQYSVFTDASKFLEWIRKQIS
ncbi:uncharacterized protein LOC131284381 [Anopheles ziemanni]|uniref:uncharacterized protein LOC131272892 n=1 Tax=Anopheles coustani TaxID=139045 RepID=UPI0026592587|nr:uncharacterized protein LOC131272892 [Anopheles coustani]XP_058169218.1 uncharacterized protein LOC131284381 [Anopheles ziemanni]